MEAFPIRSENAAFAKVKVGNIKLGVFQICTDIQDVNIKQTLCKTCKYKSRFQCVTQIGTRCLVQNMSMTCVDMIVLHENLSKHCKGSLDTCPHVTIM